MKFIPTETLWHGSLDEVKIYGTLEVNDASYFSEMANFTDETFDNVFTVTLSY
jgi:hypothetical protein